ncbi:ROK family protein [Rhodobacterales bacterium HKCCE3408]|nr:ROK family protein [Rhodobacterales bacterium HKCCE3408]
MAAHDGGPADTGPVDVLRPRRSANERRILALIQRLGPLASVDLARLAGLSAQSASVITRGLEADGLVRRGEPVRGKVGKPLTPIGLNPDGAYAVGLRIGRRTADLVLLDFVGRVHGHLTERFPYPAPGRIRSIVAEGVDRLAAPLAPGARSRISGLGVGAPFEMWKWLDDTPVPRDDMLRWKDFDMQAEFAAVTGLPVTIGNDASMACTGEHMFGAASDLTDFAYLYIGSFIGGGLVLGNRLHVGSTGNAGAFGSLPIRASDGSWQQLIALASKYTLEARIEARMPGGAPRFFDEPGWTGHDDLLDTWIGETVEALAAASVAAVALLDVPTVVIDGNLPRSILTRLVDGTREAVASLDTRGIHPFALREGRLGRMAGALGSGYQPIIHDYFLE